MSPSRRERAPLATINITSLVDVLLILVAALLLLAPQFVKPLPVELPETAFAGQPTPQRSLIVSLTEAGTLVVEGETVSLSRFLARVEANSTTVEIAADGAVPYEEVVQLVEAIRPTSPREIVLLTR